MQAPLQPLRQFALGALNITLRHNDRLDARPLQVAPEHIELRNRAARILKHRRELAARRVDRLRLK